MNKSNLIKTVAGAFLATSLLAGCQTGYTVSAITGGRVAVTSALDATPDSAALATLAPYQHIVDSIMSPLVGHSACFMDRYRPESPLSNLVADILRRAAQPVSGKTADVAVTNMGGLRTSLPEGEVTFGNIYEITPFENYLCVMTMKGSVLRSLFEDIAAVKGEGLSGARLVITKDGKLVSAEVGGAPLDDERDYVVSTIDYLAEGNDRMTTFAQVPDEVKLLYPKATLRGLFLDYVVAQEQLNQPLEAKVEGRIVVVEE